MKRYDLGREYAHQIGAPAITEQPDGAYVRYDDYAAVFDELRSEKRALEGIVAGQAEAIAANSQPAMPADELLRVLDGVIDLAKEARSHWDAGRDMKVGKILVALSGRIEGYDPRATALHTARRRIEGE